METSTPKSFWSKPEGKTGMLAVIGLGIGAVLLWSKIAPFVVAMLANTLTALVLAGLIAFILWFAFTYHKLFAWGFRLIMRKLTEIIITIDPIAVMRDYIATLKKNREELSKETANVRGIRVGLERKIADAKRDKENSLMMAKQARDQNNQVGLALNARQAERTNRAEGTYTELVQKLTGIERMLTKYGEVCDFLIVDTTGEVDIREQEYKAITSSYRAMKAAQRILQGGQDEREKFEMAMEFTLNDMAAKMGEIEEFMESSRNFVSNVDLQNGAFEAQGYAMLEAWEAKADDILLKSMGGTPKQLPGDSEVGTYKVLSPKPVAIEVGQTKAQSSSKYWDKSNG